TRLRRYPRASFARALAGWFCTTLLARRHRPCSREGRAFRRGFELLLALCSAEYVVATAAAHLRGGPSTGRCAAQSIELGCPEAPWRCDCAASGRADSPTAKSTRVH